MTADERLYGRDGDEELDSDLLAAAERLRDDGCDSPVEIEEWTTKPVRSFAGVGSIIDHLIDYTLEEALDPHGRVYDLIVKRGDDPEVVAAFDHALDLLLNDVGWRWADEHVATWIASWNGDEVDPEFRFKRKETA